MSYQYKEWDVELSWEKYQNGRLALELIDTSDDTEEPVVTRVTVNLPDEPLEEGRSFVKDWNENTGMLSWLIRHGIADPTGRWIRTGHVQVPEVLWRVPLP